MTEMERREQVRQTLSLLMELGPEVRGPIAEELGYEFIRRTQYPIAAEFMMLSLGQTPTFLRGPAVEPELGAATG